MEDIVKVIKETSQLNIYDLTAEKLSLISSKVAIDCVYKICTKGQFHDNPHIRVYNSKGYKLWTHIKGTGISQESGDKLIRNFVNDYLSVLIKFKSGSDSK